MEDEVNYVCVFCGRPLDRKYPKEPGSRESIAYCKHCESIIFLKLRSSSAFLGDDAKYETK